jgi:hypothetical protein
VLIHAIAHIEFNAINLALDAIWRFDGMPPATTDWLQVAAEEAKHFRLLRACLRHGQDYGDFPAHQGLWTMCEKTQHDIVARMALVPRTLEARAGRHAADPEQAAQVGTPDALAAATFWTSSCATRWAMWPSATTGTAGCASARLDPRRTTPSGAAMAPASPAVQRRRPPPRWLHRNGTSMAAAGLSETPGNWALPKMSWLFCIF